ncbi:hypothetical protein [Helicobacter sp. T3_23-1059]
MDFVFGLIVGDIDSQMPQNLAQKLSKSNHQILEFHKNAQTPKTTKKFNATLKRYR